MTFKQTRVAALLLLAGCAATPDEYASQVIAAYGPYCDKLGYQANTDAWRTCIQLEDAKAVAAAYAATHSRGRP